MFLIHFWWLLDGVEAELHLATPSTRPLQDRERQPTADQAHAAVRPELREGSILEEGDGVLFVSSPFTPSSRGRAEAATDNIATPTGP